MITQDYGTLQIRTYSASEALPVEDANVKITGTGEYNRDVQISIFTDRDGLTPIITLPAPNVNLSLSPGAGSLPYSEFDVEIVKEDYYSKKILSLPIFAGTKAMLPIEMLPIAYAEDGSIVRLDNLNSTIYENENLN